MADSTSVNRNQLHSPWRPRLARWLIPILLALTIGSALTWPASPADAQANVTISISGPATALNEGTDTTLTVTLSGAVTEETIVSWTSAHVTTESADYGTPVSGSLTFANGDDASNPQTFTIPLADDLLSETEESFTVSLGAVTQGTAVIDTSQQSATITIAASDQITVNLQRKTETVLEGNYAQFDVSLTPLGVIPTLELTVQYSTSGTATAGADYTTTTGTLRFSQSDAATLTISVPTLTDTAEDEGETIIVTISNLTGGGGPTATLGATSATIALEDPPTAVALTVIPASLDESSGVVDLTIRASLGAGVTRGADQVVSLSLNGTAVRNADYSITTLPSITIPTMSSSATTTFSITIVDDIADETNETIVFTGTGTDLTITPATITLADNDGAPTGLRIILSQDYLNEDSGATTITLTVRLMGGTVRTIVTPVTISLSGTATRGTHYNTPTLPTITIPAGDAEASVDLVITPVDNNNDEVAKTIVFAADAVNLTGGSRTIILDDDDGLPTGVATTINTTELGEADAPTGVTVTVTLTGGAPTSDDTIIAVALGGSAASGTDYTANHPLPTITIAGLATSETRTITITPIDDTIVEGTETIFVGGTTSGLPVKSAILDLIDNQAPPLGSPSGTEPRKDTATLSISSPPNQIAEGSDAQFKVTLSRQVNATVSVRWRTQADTASTQDYNASSGTLTFPANSAAGATQFISIAITDDTLSEGPETFKVLLDALTTVRNEQVSIRTTSADAIIAESNPVTVTLTGPTTVAEGSFATYTVTLSPSTEVISTDLTVDFTTMSASAAASDFTAISGQVTFTPSSSAVRKIRVQTTTDDMDEPDETFTLALSNLQGGGTPASLATPSMLTTTITKAAVASTPPPPTWLAPTTVAPTPVAPDSESSRATPTPKFRSTGFGSSGSVSPTNTPFPEVTPQIPATPLAMPTPRPTRLNPTPTPTRVIIPTARPELPPTARPQPSRIMPTYIVSTRPPPTEPPPTPTPIAQTPTITPRPAPTALPPAVSGIVPTVEPPGQGFGTYRSTEDSNTSPVDQTREAAEYTPSGENPTPTNATQPSNFPLWIIGLIIGLVALLGAAALFLRRSRRTPQA